jgi:hypothetical protein
MSAPRRLTRILAALAGISLLGLLTTPGAGAQSGPEGFFLEIDPVGEATDQPTFDFHIDGEPCLSDTVVEVEGVPGATVTLDNPNAGTIVLPAGTPGGSYEVIVTCTTDAGEDSFDAFLEFGHVVVEKVVEGDAPADATFVIDVSCEAEPFLQGAGAEGYDAGPEGGSPPVPVQGQLTFGPEGGTGALVHYRTQACTITEPEDGGAAETTIETSDCFGDEEGPIINGEADAGVSGDFFIDAPVDCTQTVTNVFAAAEAIPVTPAFTG